MNCHIKPAHVLGVHLATPCRVRGPCVYNKPADAVPRRCREVGGQASTGVLS